MTRPDVVANARKSMYAAFGRKSGPDDNRIDRGVSQRRHLPAQAGSRSERLDAGSLSQLESESIESVIERGLWRYHRLLPPPSDSPWRSRFERLLKFFLYYTSFWLPMRVSFFQTNPPLQGVGWQVVDGIDFVIDALFWVDIAMTCRTCIYDKVTQELVTDWRDIMRRYTAFWFWVETLTNLPWEALAVAIWGYQQGNTGNFKLIRLARSFRLFKGRSEATAQSVARRLFTVLVSAHTRARAARARPPHAEAHGAVAKRLLRLSALPVCATAIAPPLHPNSSAAHLHRRRRCRCHRRCRRQSSSFRR